MTVQLCMRGPIANVRKEFGNAAEPIKPCSLIRTGGATVDNWVQNAWTAVLADRNEADGNGSTRRNNNHFHAPVSNSSFITTVFGTWRKKANPFCCQLASGHSKVLHKMSINGLGTAF